MAGFRWKDFGADEILKQCYCSERCIMEINLSILLMIFGLGITLIGALFGVIGILGENSDTYYGRAFFYAFNLDYYISMVNQKYRSLLGFLLIGIGTAMQISGNFVYYTFHIVINESIFYLIALMLFFLLFLVIEICIKSKVQGIVAKKVLRDYFDKYTKVDPLKDNKKERLENIYCIVFWGRKKEFKEIDESDTLKKAAKVLKKYNI
ncbi:MAG: hypothetical protein WA131_12865 [Desulfitobacteriaceae bacterium]